jgi:hypothetical protein
MRKVYAIFFVLLLIAPLVSQERTGNIYGTVVDEDGNPLPGVTITLTGRLTGEMSAITTERGIFRFPSLAPAKDYSIKMELEGFKTKIEQGIIVAVGRNTDLILKMELGALEEEVTVTAVSPVVDVKKTSITQTIDYETLQSLPSARDPWVIMQMTPNVQVDRENVGGSESGQQASYVALGGGTANQTWTFDGVNITDPAARGASPTYYDYDVFDEMNVTVGGADVETMTGGVSLNLVSRRGGNKTSFGGRFYYTDEAFQSLPSGTQYEELKTIFGEDAGYNKIRDIKDFGFNLGGPIIQDKLWWWGSYGVQQIKTNVINGSADDTFLNNYAFKVNVQLIPENRFEFFIHAGDKKKYGRGSNSRYPPGRNQHGKYRFGSPILKLQDEHMFGDSLFLSVKYGFTDAGFGLWPANDEDLMDLRWYDVANDIDLKSFPWFFSGRPNKQLTVHGTYYLDELFGASHEIKIGAEYSDKRDEFVSGNPGNMRVWSNYNTPQVDWDGDGTRDVMIDDFGIDLKLLRFYRGSTLGGPQIVKTYTAFLKDTISWNRLTLNLGVRYDSQKPFDKGGIFDSIFTEDSSATYLQNYYETQHRYLGPGVPEKINSLFPGTVIPEAEGTLGWNFLSPRIGLTYDVTGDGKTIAKLSGAVYNEVMGSFQGYLWTRAGAGGSIMFWWNDMNNDEAAALNELYWASYDAARTAYPAFDDSGNFVGNWAREENLMWLGYDYTNPTATTASRYQVDPNWHGNKTYEIIATVEREITTDFAVAVDVTWRKYSDFRANRRYATEAGGRLLERSDFMPAIRPVPNSFTDPKTGETIDLGEAAGKPWYVWADGIQNIYERYQMNTPSDYYNQYIGVDFRFNKRLSNRWMFSGSFTLQSQNVKWGEDWPLDPTNQWAEDGYPYAYTIGNTSGKLGQPVFSRWMAKAQGLYQLPYGFNISFTFNAREGHIIDNQISIADYDNPNPYSQSSSVRTESYGTSRLPTYWNLNMRLEKMISLGDIGKITLMVDAFNVFNQNILNRQRAVNPGTIYLHNGTFAANARSGEPNEVLNPRVFRFGLRFIF